MISVRAQAKINLFLQVIGKRDDGYHEIDSILQSISLFDQITLSENSSGIQLTVSDRFIPLDHRNTAFKAAQIFFDKTGIQPGVKIDIKKNIPVAAGLAGGSADAAAVLMGLNRLFKTDLTESDFLTLGAEVGSDVPFCTVGGTCRCRGRGEVVVKVDPLPKSYFVLVKPDFEVSTKWVYENFDLVWIKEKRLVGTHTPYSSLTLYNDLEKVVFPKYPQVAEVIKRLTRLGCLKAGMSGSGPSVFGLAEDKKSAEKIAGELKQEYPQTFAVESVDRGVNYV